MINIIKEQKKGKSKSSSSPCTPSSTLQHLTTVVAPVVVLTRKQDNTSRKVVKIEKKSPKLHQVREDFPCSDTEEMESSMDSFPDCSSVNFLTRTLSNNSNSSSNSNSSYNSKSAKHRGRRAAIEALEESSLRPQQGKSPSSRRSRVRKTAPRKQKTTNREEKTTTPKPRHSTSNSRILRNAAVKTIRRKNEKRNSSTKHDAKDINSAMVIPAPPPPPPPPLVTEEKPTIERPKSKKKFSSIEQQSKDSISNKCNNSNDDNEISEAATNIYVSKNESFGFRMKVLDFAYSYESFEFLGSYLR